MNRNEAVTYLKEVLGSCSGMSPNAVSFDSTSSEAQGYRVHIKGVIHESDKQQVREIAKKYSLMVQESADGVVVYTPNA